MLHGGMNKQERAPSVRARSNGRSRGRVLKFLIAQLRPRETAQPDGTAAPSSYGFAI